MSSRLRHEVSELLQRYTACEKPYVRDLLESEMEAEGLELERLERTFTA